MHGIYRDKGYGICLFNIVHEFAVFRLIDDRDDLALRLAAVCADRLIDRSTAVQIFKNKLTDLIFFLGENANAALLVTVNPADFPSEGPLGGALWQQELEARAFAVSGSYRAPAQKVGDFLNGIPSTGCGCVQPTYRPGVCWCDLNQILPEKIAGALKEALPQLDRNLAGFAHPEAVLTAPETRSSSPVRILRNEKKQSDVKGLYPCGEGAGNAGGIMSAAVDGILCAEALIAALEGNADEC